MKKLTNSKLTWITALPVCVFTILVKVLQSLGVQFPFDDYIVSYSVITVILAMFAINIIFVATDNKTSPVHILNRNIPASLFALLSSVFVTAYSVLAIIQILQAGAINFVAIVTAGFGVLSAIGFVIVALAHFQGRNYMPRMGAYLLVLPCWSCLMLISEFLNNRQKSALTIDPIKLFTFLFAMIFLYMVSMVIATIDGKNPVKACFLYGLPMAVCGVGYGVSEITSVFVNGLDFSENSLGFAFFAIALYGLSVIWELTAKLKTTDEQIAVFDAGDIDENNRMYGAEGDDLLIPEENTGDYDYDYGNAITEAEDFVTELDYNYLEEKDKPINAPSDEEDFIVATENDTDENDDAIYISKDKAESFESGILERQYEELSEEDSKRIDDLIAEINTNNNE
ncbi:MAG: hypothetical protein ACI4Q8_00790 [Ruminococcus sp.]